MAFTYNTSFHRTNNSAPFKVTFGINVRTSDYDSRRLYGEDLPTEMYQRMQMFYDVAKSLVRNNKNAFDC
jgi:hypothetical protein